MCNNRRSYVCFLISPKAQACWETPNTFWGMCSRPLPTRRLGGETSDWRISIQQKLSFPQTLAGRPHANPCPTTRVKSNLILLNRLRAASPQAVSGGAWGLSSGGGGTETLQGHSVLCSYQSPWLVAPGLHGYCKVNRWNQKHQTHNDA